MIVFKKKFIRIAEAWGGEEPSAEDVDLVRCFQRTEPAADSLCREFYTIIIDLTPEPDALFAALRKGCQYKVRRAEARDNFVYECWSGDGRGERERDALARFSELYDWFAARKRLPKIDRTWLSLMAGTGMLDISCVREQTGAPLVWHTHHRGAGKATFLHSASRLPDLEGEERSRLGRASRLHHWRDMLRFKSEGASVYDFGGWYQGSEDKARLGINRFKEEFGGTVVKNYICERPLTLRGKLFLRLRQSLLGDAI